jgi:proton glutamate symport protein
VMPLVVLRLLGRVHPWRFVQALGPALITAFSTASSSATLPQTLTCVQGRAGISPRVSGFTIPLGATVNMDGTALYECVAVLFLAQLAGIELAAAEQFLVVALALLTSIGVAGIPSLIAIAVILNSVNAQLPEGGRIPDASLALILIVDRPLDMCRTAVNVWGDACCAAAIARSEGERGPLAIGS